LRLPEFGIHAYTEVLERFLHSGYAARRISDLDKATEPDRVLYLRHDLEYLVTSAVRFAVAEAERRMTATYYVLLTGPYNAFAPHNCRAIKEIAALGHEIGLHYDLQAMGAGPGGCHTRIDDEVRMLEDLLQAPVRTINTHSPSLAGEDPFRSVPGLRHPHDPRDHRKLAYISDSRRTWRDDSLLQCFGAAPPKRVMFLTHPELWLAPEIRDAATYLRECVAPRALAPVREYFQREVPRLWELSADAAHPGQGRRVRLHFCDRNQVEARIEAIEERFAAQVGAGPWGRSQILADRPGKWDYSLIAVDGDSIAGFSFNSRRDDWLYVHALIVGAEYREEGLGGRILAALRERAQHAGLRGVQLRVAFDNTAAIRFYLQHGFTVIDAEPPKRQLVIAMLTASHGD
jgi:ribosomal protein S18 acetylase RimI-like enzyme